MFLEKITKMTVELLQKNLVGQPNIQALIHPTQHAEYISEPKEHCSSGQQSWVLPKKRHFFMPNLSVVIELMLQSMVP